MPLSQQSPAQTDPTALIHQSYDKAKTVSHLKLGRCRLAGLLRNSRPGLQPLSLCSLDGCIAAGRTLAALCTETNCKIIRDWKDRY